MKSQIKLSSLEQLTFDNRYTNELPADSETGNFIRQVYGASYSRVQPTKVKKPQLVAYSKEVAELINVSEAVCQSQAFADVFAGNRLISGMEPYAMCYGGHQFGVWAGQLGDGRVINLGDVINHNGERWALQLKGAGLTPYSRHADGLAVLRSSIREFLCSEAMHHLGVPTTRALSIVLTGETVIRDMFYDGNPKPECGAVVCRVATSFIRFGHFQICTANGDVHLLRKLTDHTIRTYFQHLGEPSTEIYISWFAEVCKKTAELMVEWERVGFVHGVMNTDNMSILGLTIDYGPYGWLEGYDPNWTPNTTDAEERRYRFGNQAACAYWNLVQLANAIYPLINVVEPLQEALADFVTHYEFTRNLMLTRKLGLKNSDPKQDEVLHSELLAILQLVETDMTIFFRRLAAFDLNDVDQLKPNQVVNFFLKAFYDETVLTSDYVARLSHWLSLYSQRVNQDSGLPRFRQERMNSVNPNYVLRNYLAQLAIDKAEKGDFTMVTELLELFRKPYEEQPNQQHYAEKRPEWARSRAGCSMLSCSS